jgi:hypothetical protein
MTATTAETGLRLRVEIIVAPASPIQVVSTRRSRSIRALVGFVTLLLVLNAAVALVLETGPAHLRDPEYGLRLNSLQKKRAEYPERKLTVVLGSSRTAMGIRPDVCEAALGNPHDAPLLFNMSMTGAGPILQFMTLQRLLADGVRPNSVLLEFWPALMRGDGPYREETRIDVERLRPEDEPAIAAHFANPSATQRRMQNGRTLPLWYHRRALLNRLWPEALSIHDRTDATWAELDEWGWLPGRISATPLQIERGWPQVAAFYEPLFRTYEISPIADRAIRASIALCRENGIAVSLIALPESARFRSIMTPESIRLSSEYRDRLRSEWKLPLVDGSAWAGDSELPDGFHLTRAGAAEFTRKLAADMCSPAQKK